MVCGVRLALETETRTKLCRHPSFECFVCDHAKVAHEASFVLFNSRASERGCDGITPLLGGGLIEEIYQPSLEIEFTMQNTHYIRKASFAPLRELF